MHSTSLLLQVGYWLGSTGALLALFTVVAFFTRWGIRFRMVGISSFTVLLAAFCWAFAVSYTPRVNIEGALNVPVAYDNGSDLVVATYPMDAPVNAVLPTLQQLAANLRPQGRTSADGMLHIRLRRLESAGEGRSRPVIVAEASKDLRTGDVVLKP